MLLTYKLYGFDQYLYSIHTLRRKNNTLKNISFYMVFEKNFRKEGGEREIAGTGNLGSLRQEKSF